MTNQHILYATVFETAMGSLTAIADKKALYLVELTDYIGIENVIKRLIKMTSSSIITGITSPLSSFQEEMHAYLDGSLKQFQTPIRLLGSPFQVAVWECLRHIPYGETRSYAHIAASLGNPLAYRAVAQANATTQLAIIIPCHRVINQNGALGGYGRGLYRKKWLIDHEKNFL